MMTAESFSFLLGFDERQMQAAETQPARVLRNSLAPVVQYVGDIAIAPIKGVLAYNPDAFEMLYHGIEDSRAVTAMLDGLQTNRDVAGVLVDMDTPGGMMLGGPEIGDAVANLVRSGKPVVTHIGGLGASLGYLIASQSSEIVANRSAMVGSIGVIQSTTDWTKYLADRGIKIEVFTNKEAKFKAAGAVGTSLTDDHRTQIQSQVDYAFALFKGAVTSARPQVKAEAMQGQAFRGEEAKSRGLIDRIGGINLAMSVLRQRMHK